MKHEIVQSVDRAFKIIEVLGTGKKKLLDLAKEVELNKSTVHRLLHTLIYKGYVIQDTNTSQYQLAPKFLLLGQQIIDDMDIISISKSFIDKLNKKTGEVVHLVMIENLEAIYIDKREAVHNIRMYSYIGKRIPLSSSAVGKAYLAFSDKSVKKRIWPNIINSLEKFTENTLTKEELEVDLEIIKTRGFAIDREENEMGIICVAAPIYNHLGIINFAISISTPKFRLDEDKINLFGSYAKKTANEISSKFGYNSIGNIK